MKTFSAKPLDVERSWWVIDATGLTLGRLATVIANLLRGKHKPSFTPNIDTGDFVIVTNVEKIVVSGKKAQQKKYYDHSLYPGGLRTTLYRDMKPERILERAVWGMLPHTSLGRQQKLKLKIYTGAEHPHQAQMPKVFTVQKKTEVA
jgi:large subunit ribosomal protein L13